MKILILIILLNAETGDIEQGKIVGTARDSATCMAAAGMQIDEDKKQGAIRDNQVPFPMCIDIEPMIPREAKKVML